MRVSHFVFLPTELLVHSLFCTHSLCDHEALLLLISLIKVGGMFYSAKIALHSPKTISITGDKRLTTLMCFFGVRK